jgi:hypothetical protein
VKRAVKEWTPFNFQLQVSVSDAALLVACQAGLFKSEVSGLLRWEQSRRTISIVSMLMAAIGQPAGVVSRAEGARLLHAVHTQQKQVTNGQWHTHPRSIGTGWSLTDCQSQYRTAENLRDYLDTGQTVFVVTSGGLEWLVRLVCWTTEAVYYQDLYPTWRGLNLVPASPHQAKIWIGEMDDAKTGSIATG